MTNYKDVDGNVRSKSAIEKRNNRKKIEAIKRRKRRRRNRRISIILSIIVILIISGFIYINSFLNKLNTNNLKIAANPPDSSEPINILITGMDIGDSENTENADIRRTDTIMVLNYNPTTKKSMLVSVPRDTLIEVDAYNGNEYRRYWKINTAYALGGEEEIIYHVENLLNISINYVVEIDYQAFRSIVDALGGVEVYIEQDMYYDDEMQDLHIRFNKGDTVQLNGELAEKFIRWRKNNDGTGYADADLGRITNQQLFIKKLAKKALSPTSIFKLPKVLKAISDNVDTNMDSNTMISLALKIVKSGIDEIKMVTLQGEEEYIYGDAFLIVDKDLNYDIIEALNSGTTFIDDNEVDRGLLKILVLNGTNTSGLAGSVREQLLSLGYTNVDVDNAIGVSKSSIQLRNEDLEDILKDELNIKKFSKITSDEYSYYDIVVLLGEDF